MAKTAKKPVFSPNPTFAQVTPVIQGFDYNTGINAMVDENSIAGIGLLPDETHNAHPPQGYPWNGHKPPPGYPWEGHAPSSPNTGIEGLAPMRQGGPNFPAPAASTAYPQVDPTTGEATPTHPPPRWVHHRVTHWLPPRSAVSISGSLTRHWTATAQPVVIGRRSRGQSVPMTTLTSSLRTARSRSSRRLIRLVSA